MKVDIGRRIRFFRKRDNVSQLDLENEIDGSSGMVSRIENNLVNPKKETIIKIANVLRLSNEEIDYLIGKTRLPANDEEIKNAKNEATQELGKKGKLNYLLDERWRFHSFSETFLKFLYLSSNELNYIIGRTTTQLIVRDDSPILQRLNKEYYEQFLTNYLSIYFSNMSYMDDDEIYRLTVKDIMSNVLAKRIWLEVTDKNDRKYTPQEDRIIYFDLKGSKVNLYYSIQPLLLNSRFTIVEYHTENKVSNLLKDFV